MKIPLPFNMAFTDCSVDSCLHEYFGNGQWIQMNGCNILEEDCDSMNCGCDQDPPGEYDPHEVIRQPCIDLDPATESSIINPAGYGRIFWISRDQNAPDSLHCVVCSHTRACETPAAEFETLTSEDEIWKHYYKDGREPIPPTVRVPHPRVPGWLFGLDGDGRPLGVGLLVDNEFRDLLLNPPRGLFREIAQLWWKLFWRDE